jgi:membrane associated rhomboid family serine protease
MKRSRLLRYESLTHVAVTSRALLIATTSGLSILRTRDFLDSEEGPEQARRALLARLAARPDSDFGLRQIGRLDALYKRNAKDFAVWAVVALCVLATLAQIFVPMVQDFGSFIPELFGRGEFWRAVTAHFLHGAPTVPIHLAVNVGGLFALGHLVERPLGSLRTVVVLALGAVGTILGSLYYGYSDVIGSSGLVSALAGAIAALEFHYPELVPAQWRLPRRLLIWALLLQFAVIDQVFSSFLAGGAHLGGFAGGYVAVWLLARSGLDEERVALPLRMVALTAVLVLLMGILTAVPLIRHDMGALERHALRLLNTTPAVNPWAIQHDNAVAWFIATEGEPSPGGLDLAVALADRAVDATGRRDANLLDTLAEALFRAGDRLAALLTIDEAIRLAPAEPYFREQRRRYTGERNADDRPDPPGSQGRGDPESFDDERRLIDPAVPAITI